MNVDKSNVGKRATIIALSARRAEYVGQSGVIRQAVKSRNVYTLELDDDELMIQMWDLSPQHLEIQQ
jgi:hypothetical protein